MLRALQTGLTVAFIGLSDAACCSLIGVETSGTSMARSENETVGTRRFAHPTTLDCFVTPLLAMTTRIVVRRMDRSPFLPLRELLGEKFRQHLDARGARAARRGDEMQGTLGLPPAFEDHLDIAGGDHVA